MFTFTFSIYFFLPDDGSTVLVVSGAKDVLSPVIFVSVDASVVILTRFLVLYVFGDEVRFFLVNVGTVADN